MSNQIQATGAVKIRSLTGALTATSGVVSSVPLGGANGVATLDSTGKIPVTQLPSSVMEYKGTWNASTNTPTLTNGVGDTGDVWVCNVAGTANFGAGPITFAVGDWAVYNGSIWQKSGGASGTVTSVAVTDTSDALSITGSPITTFGTINIGFAGVAAQYVRGDGSLATFPTAGGGGGGGAVYYFNGNTSEGTILGNAYYQLSTAAGSGTSSTFTHTGDGLLACFITDSGKPNQTKIPAGVWTFEVYASETGGGSGHAEIYTQVEVYNGTSFTIIATSIHEQITNGNVKDLYTFACSIPETTISSTDRIAIQFYNANTSGKSVTLYTEGSNFSSVNTTFPIGISTLNGLTANTQYFTTGTSGTDFNISSATATHIFNLPTASATNRGALSTTDWTNFQNAYNLRIVTTNTPLSFVSNTLSIQQANSTQSGYLSSTDWNNFQTAYTNRITSATSPLSISSNNISIQQASATLSGYLSSTDWNTFNGKVGGTGTLNYLPKITATGTSITLGNSLVYDDGTNIGIGTTSPSYKFDVNGIGRFVNQLYASSFVTTSQNGVTIDVNGGTTGGALKFTQTASTSVGGPSESSLSAISNTQFLFNYGISSGVYKGFKFDNSLLTTNTYRTYYLPDSSGTLVLSTQITGSTNYVAKFGATALANSLIYDNGTNVGIGTVSPSFLLDVNGSSRFTGTLYANATALLPALYVNGVNSQWATKIYGGSGTGVSSGLLIQAGTNSSDSPFTATSYDASNIYFKILGNGNVGINNSTPSYLLDVNGTTNITGQLRLGSTITNGTYTYTLPSLSGTLVVSSQITGTTNYISKFSSTGLINSLLWDNGTNVGVGNTNTTYTFDVTGTGRFTGQLTLGSTISNGTYTYTLPSATGTLLLGTGANKQVAFFNGTSNVKGSTGFYYDESNVYLGIGTSNPSAGVTVYSFNAATHFKAAGTAPAFTFSDTLTSTTYAAVFGLATSNNQFITGTVTGDFAIANQSATPGAIVFGTGTVEKMRMTSAGTFSIGNTNSTYNLDVTGTGRFTGALTGTTATFTAGTFNPSFIAIGNSVGNGQIQLSNSANYKIGAGTDYGGMAITVGGSDRIYILNDGKVGIGTSSPSYILDVQYGGNISQRIRNNAAGGTATLLLETANTFSGTSQAYVQCIGSTGGGQSQLVFATAGASGDSTATERMRITSGGNVLIGLTSSSNKFTVSAGGTTPDLYVNSSGGVGSYNLGTGLVYSNAGILTSTNPSDRRLKENIQDISWGLADILKLRPVHYTWKEDRINQGLQFGFIAQEVQEIMPEAIKEYGDDIRYLGLEKDAIYATLVKAIQEQQKQIEELKSLINK